ncbi:S-adenosyl-L-methionine-dependent methyltransferase [Daldinia decipiens]|uniref:S-adenosyl-L-methionine-dependent methyltransferase n=1 Tax=Daldinia decipiens TaxID=326647 RepID=UPI0020C38985|nr:S-adenosyl-L-methionine-dependent methyltransferase [Daldinia decipiens]KAI1659192.1 S-adenosyl-L-methionine-dependent methyltransferase [Daldinia decipiens]
MQFYKTITPRLLLRTKLATHPVFGSLQFSLQSLTLANCHIHLSEVGKGIRLYQLSKRPKSRQDTTPDLSAAQVIRMIRSPNFKKMASSDGQVKMGSQHQEPRPNRGKRPFQNEKSKLATKKENKKKQKKTKESETDMNMKTGSAEEVLAIDVKNLIESLKQDDDRAVEGGNAAPEPETENLPEQGSEIEVEVVELSSTGEGLALRKGSKHVYVVPFSIPGDTVKAKVYRHLKEEGYSVADYISLVKPSASRDDSRIKCKYFATCSGCQFQMLDYTDQLKHKKNIVEKAFRHFSELPPELIPAIQDTIGSPLQYGYRTKLTPHFDGPPGWRKGKNPFKSCPPIGFMPKGKRDPLDIEDCPIGTDAIRLGMKKERARMAVEYGKYVRGATILLRESTKRIPKKQSEAEGASSPKGPEAKSPSPPPPEDSVVRVETDSYTDLKTYVTDNNGTSTEYVGPYVFHNPAGSFFQNNNSILPVFTDYIREHILPPSSPLSPEIKFLLDAYSGSGLFTITLSSLFSDSVGIDISDASIKYASRNGAENNLPLSRAKFIAGDAKDLFASALRKAYPCDQTVVVIDPPRKGCDQDFLNQLLRFAPRRVVYVSCNVHTQARDIGILVRGLEGAGGAETGTGMKTGVAKNKWKGTKYAIESIRGFDFFPQTGHVEGVAILNRVDG